MAEGNKKLQCMKYSFMSCNAFGVMIGIFLVLFGSAYKEVSFPGGFTGGETAIFSGVFIFFTLIGYCGAHHQKIYFLALYGIIIMVFLAGNIFVMLFKPEKSVFDIESNAVIVLGFVFFMLMVFAFVLLIQLRKSSLPMSASSFQMGSKEQNMMHPSASTSFITIQRVPPNRGFVGHVYQ